MRLKGCFIKWGFVCGIISCWFKELDMLVWMFSFEDRIFLVFLCFKGWVDLVLDGVINWVGLYWEDVLIFVLFVIFLFVFWKILGVRCLKGIFVEFLVEVCIWMILGLYVKCFLGVWVLFVCVLE